MPTPTDFERTRVIVFGGFPGARYRAGRTLRILKRHFPNIIDATVLRPKELSRLIDADESPVWLLRAGTIPCGLSHWFLPASPGKRPLCAFGLLKNCSTPETPRANAMLRESLGNEFQQAGRDAVAWQHLQAESGGDFCIIERLDERLPRIDSVLIGAPRGPEFSFCVEFSPTIDCAIRLWLPKSSARCVRLPHLDYLDDPALRIAQVVTSLQRGGAERVALDLTRELPRCGVRPLLFTLGTPTRAAFPTPEDAVEFPPGQNRAEHIRNFVARAVALGCDAVHAHLLSAEDMALVAESGLPVVATVHNVKQGWPAGFLPLSPRERADAQQYRARGEGSAPRIPYSSRLPVALLAACSQAVERDLLEANLGAPVRTIWNGIDVAGFQPTPENRDAALRLRQQLELAPSDFVLISLANPRPQKRLELIPTVIIALRAELSARGIARDVKWIVAGEAARSSDDAMCCESMLRAEIQRLNLSDAVRFVGAAKNVAALLNASDALVSVSAWEGLSLAHLEALAAGIPVVATDAGGTAEIAVENPALTVVPLDAAPELIAAKLADLAKEPRMPVSGAESDKRSSFTLHTMTARYASIYPRAIESARGPRNGEGLWLIANNFTTGGAQTSARRLLLGLKAEGIPVRAAVLQEREDHPTPGLTALREASVPVFIPEPRAPDPLDAVMQILERIDADPPRAILFWNVIAEHKVLIADAIWDIPIIDVSPGEMYFDSLHKYFAAPRPGLPYRSAAEYGTRLTGVVVKYGGEKPRAEEFLKVKTHVISNGLPLGVVGQTFLSAGESRQECLPHHPIPIFVIGTSARISPQKRLEDLIEALRLAAPDLPPHILKIAGRPETGGEEYAEKLKHLGAGLNTEWCGEYQSADTFLNELDLFAMISEPAGCPNASLEAMAAGLPVVATDYGGASEQVFDGITGRLVPRANARAFADALIELARDPDKRVALGAAGRARVGERFSVERMVEDYRRICGV